MAEAERLCAELRALAKERREDWKLSASASPTWSEGGVDGASHPVPHVATWTARW